ncbi:hypothetical protein [Dokdonella koreensis]|uniref:Uncharacterized protein n=1 Tax=Dokdonella koreensis DS-123 TaxID=1300342 RepID=A0A160DU55_9GAMM|nr:hypothetical protein [Dokdonella koreensis]ANB17965.1 Hypothetical protein I596_1943 [Dokdonella koreensis DS-123]
MKKIKGWAVALGMLVLTLAFDLVVWGAVPSLPHVGEHIAASARREAPLAATYIFLGRPIDDAVPTLRGYGAGWLEQAWSEGFARIAEDGRVAMDLVTGSTWNAAHRWIKLAYWAPPVLLPVFLVLWARRPRQIRMMGARR